jgi:hypothetical protein
LCLFAHGVGLADHESQMEGLMFRPLVPAVIAAVILGCAPAIARQTPIVSPTYPTRSPNLNLQRFDPKTSVWRTRATEHFDIYHAQQTDLDEIAREAERAYSRVSLDLGHELSAKVPLIVLPSNGDLPRDRQEASALVRASGAPDTDHLLLPVEPRDRRPTVLAHELTHVFQFELLPNSRVPRWASEGLADLMTGTWEASDLLKLREAADAGLLPSVASLTDSERMWGHAVFNFVAAEYGSRGVQQYLIALRNGSHADATRTAFGVAAADFDKAFHAYVRRRLVER